MVIDPRIDFATRRVWTAPLSLAKSLFSPFFHDRDRIAVDPEFASENPRLGLEPSRG
jgi:hypothetical protein